MERSDKTKKPHDGHRQRIRSRFIHNGIGMLDDADILEMILIYSVPRRDVYEKARQLVRMFGSAENVLCATTGELRCAGELSEISITLIKLINEIRGMPFCIGRYRGEKLVNVSDAARFCHKLIGHAPVETVVEIFLDNENRVMDIAKVSDGVHDRTELPIPAIMEQASRRNVSRVIVAHNHPSGSSFPSEADVTANNALIAALHTQKMELVEHVVVAEKECTLIMHSQKILIKTDTGGTHWKGGCHPSSNPTGQ